MLSRKMKQYQKKKAESNSVIKAGFTLIELIIVVAILVLLYMAVKTGKSKAKQGTAETDINTAFNNMTQIMTEASAAQILPTAQFQIKSKIYPRGYYVTIPCSYVDKSNPTAKYGFYTITVKGGAVVITSKDPSDTLEKGLYDLGADTKKEGSVSGKSVTFKTTDTGIIADENGIKPIFSEEQLNDENFLRMFLRSIGFEEDQLKSLSADKLKTILINIFGTQGKQGAIQLMQVDMLQLKPFVEGNVKKFQDTSKGTLYIVTSINKSKLLANKDLTGYSVLSEKVKKNTMVWIPTSEDYIVYSQASQYKDGIFLSN